MKHGFYLNQFSHLVWFAPGPRREILPGERRPVPGPLASRALVKNCIACLYNNQNRPINKTAVMLVFKNI